MWPFPIDIVLTTTYMVVVAIFQDILGIFKNHLRIAVSEVWNAIPHLELKFENLFFFPLQTRPKCSRPLDRQYSTMTKPYEGEARILL